MKYSLKHKMKWARLRLKVFVATTIVIELCICATAVIFICIFTFFTPPYVLKGQGLSLLITS